MRSYKFGCERGNICNRRLAWRCSTNYDDVESYDPSTDSWDTKTSMPTARHYASSTVVNDEIYVIGGEDTPDENLNLVEKYIPVNDIQ